MRTEGGKTEAITQGTKQNQGIFGTGKSTQKQTEDERKTRKKTRNRGLETEKKNRTRKRTDEKQNQGRQIAQRRKQENTEEGASIQPAAPHTFITTFFVLSRGTGRKTRKPERETKEEKPKNKTGETNEQGKEGETRQRRREQPVTTLSSSSSFLCVQVIFSLSFIFSYISAVRR